MYDKIKVAMFNIGSNKRPNPSGFMSFFSKATWAITGKYIYYVVRYFFASSELLKYADHHSYYGT